MRVRGEPTLLQVQDTLYQSKNPTRRWIHTLRRETIEALLSGAAGSGGVEKAMEIGPGSGLYLPLLSELSRELVVTDIEPSFLERAHQRVDAGRDGATTESKQGGLGNGKTRFVVDDITNSELPPGTFDLILCTEVIEHIPDWRAALRSIARLMRPGGALVLSTPQPRSPLELAGKVAYLPGVVQLVRAIYREPILDPGHVSLISARRLEQELAANGLCLEQRRWTGTYLPVVAELGGTAALRLEQALEPRLQARPWRGLLWTQYVVARR